MPRIRIFKPDKSFRSDSARFASRNRECRRTRPDSIDFDSKFLSTIRGREADRLRRQDEPRQRPRSRPNVKKNKNQFSEMINLEKLKCEVVQQRFYQSN